MTERYVQYRISALPANAAFGWGSDKVVDGLYFALHVAFPSPRRGSEQSHGRSQPAPQLIRTIPALPLEP